MTNLEYLSLNNQKLRFFIPGFNPAFEIHCASIHFMPHGLAGDSNSPCIICNFDWEDEQRSGSPKAIKDALFAFEHANYESGITMKKLGSNSVVINDFGEYNFDIISENLNAKY